MAADPPPALPGAVLFAVFALALLYALSSAGHRLDWTSPTLIALLGLAALCAIALGWWERRAPDPVVARERLMARDWPARDVAPLIALIAEPGREVSAEGTYRLSEAQARAILDLRLQRLTGLERDKIAEELGEVAKLIEGYLELLADRDKLFALMRKELIEIKEQFATPRRT